MVVAFLLVLFLLCLLLALLCFLSLFLCSCLFHFLIFVLCFARVFCSCLVSCDCFIVFVATLVFLLILVHSYVDFGVLLVSGQLKRILLALGRSTARRLSIPPVERTHVPVLERALGLYRGSVQPDSSRGLTS